MRMNSMRLGGALLARCVAVAATGLLAAACSMDVTRFDGNPFNSRQDTTASVPQQQPQGPAQVPGHQLQPRVETQPLAAPPQTNYRPQTVPASPAPQAKARPLNGPQTTAAVNANDWSWDGGTAVTVQKGETVYSISRKHNVPPEVILRANNLQSASMIQPGQRLVIPKRRNGAPIHQTQTNNAQPASMHTVANGETIFALSRRYKVSPQAIASANSLTLSTQLRVGQQVRIPGAGNPIANTAPQTVPAQPVRRVETPPAVQTTQNETAPQPENVGMVRPNTPPSVNAEAPAAPNAAPSFRWPVRGRIISAYGRKPNGQQNDGINLSVPEGTPIRAAEDGVVAYAGNELKGFGNLVLIRHADNWVTAYAHNSTIDVKKDQKIKRGDIIARAGQTGGVTSPQLHFEIRKGSNPVDPEKHLSGT
jgi:murein DD-endopeptidase MepM/ murein hydrolase activator NlpD